jgi:hypothetical protein
MLAATIIAKAQAGNPEVLTSCTDLFFSELTFGKTATQNIWYLNYGVEIFNPTQSTVDLSDYSLVLTNSVGVTTTINLGDSIVAGGVYVVVNTNAGATLGQMADDLVSGLDFENNVMLVLKHNTTVIDKIGQSGQSTTGDIDLVQLIQDPYGYLANFHLDLNDYTNIDIRRSKFVDKGNPTFNSATDIIGKWSYHVNTDISDIGTHVSICNKPEGLTIIGFQDHYPAYQTEVYPCYNGPEINGGAINDPLTVTHVGSDPGNMTITQVSGTAVINGYNYPATSDMVWSNCSNCSLSTYHTSLDGSSSESLDPGYLNTPFDREALFQLSSTVYDVDLSTSQHKTIVKGCLPTRVNDFAYKNGILVYPTIVADLFTIKSNGNLRYHIVTPTGKMVQQGIADSELYTVDISKLAASSYLIILSNDHGQRFYNSIIKH